jgi:MFS transporter, DHA2 family, multidrug resistance protein
MSTQSAAISAPSAPTSARVYNPWFIALAVVVPTFMEVLDTTIANVALRYMAGGLSAPATDSEWVITSYLAANAIILPMSGWLALRLGRRNYFLLSITIFTLASALCGMAASLGMLIGARVLQEVSPAVACNRRARPCCSTHFLRRNKVPPKRSSESLRCLPPSSGT